MPMEFHQLAELRAREWVQLDQARREREAEAPALVHPPLVITISREYGAGGRTIAYKAARELGERWRVWDRELVEAIADRARVRVEMVESLDERSRSWLEQLFAGEGHVHHAQYRRHLLEVIVALGQQGDAIIVGRGANLVLPHAVRVRLTACRDARIRLLKETGRDYSDAYMKQVEQERAAFLKTWFGREIHDPTLYDMILRTDTLGIDESAAAIVGAAEARRCVLDREAASAH